MNDPDVAILHWKDIKELFTPSLIEEMRGKFGLVGSDEVIRHQLAKVLGRYQSFSGRALEPTPPPQTKELDRLKKAIERTLSAFNAVSEKNRDDIDSAIMYRDPFNRKFFFKEQLDYWETNEDSSQLAMNRLAQISHALDALKAERKKYEREPKTTRNTPLDYLIQDLTTDFERGTDRKAHRCCNWDAQSESYAGQYFDFVVFILDRFAPNSYHSLGAIGQRIKRALGGRIG